MTPEPYGRVIASDLLIRDTAELIALAGPVGLLTSGEEGAAADGALEWAHRFAEGTSIYGGTTDIQRNLIAEHLLGLPRHRGSAQALSASHRDDCLSEGRRAPERQSVR